MGDDGASAQPAAGAAIWLYAAAPFLIILRIRSHVEQKIVRANSISASHQVAEAL